MTNRVYELSYYIYEINFFGRPVRRHKVNICYLNKFPLDKHELFNIIKEKIYEYNIRNDTIMESVEQLIKGYSESKIINKNSNLSVNIALTLIEHDVIEIKNRSFDT